MRVLRAPATVLVALVLTSCAAVTPPAATSSSPTTSAVPAPTPSSTASPTAAAIATLSLSLGHLDAADASGAVAGTARLDDGDAVVQLLSRTLGAPVSQEHHTDPWDVTTTKWDGVIVSVYADSAKARITFLAAASAGVSLRSAIGVSVGMTREATIAAGATPTASFTDTSGAVHQILVSESTQQPGTNSLVTPGDVGSVYVEHESVDGTVTRIAAPGDDFSDL
ncbi:hypothetical protein NFX31_10545 [Microbacterium azadirachtae]|uniref:hypothetical protein n=1 Tax=Microbacterium azadirachtae TaxID=582680 RepID=UPI0021D4AABE|nr:hypothetical protein [Microbacterium azadirachtae]UXW84678.1 hypothetical protein NFX31_10545 [Microbacterium azadirachtae]